MPQEPQPKISDVEVILIGAVFALFDLIEILLVIFAVDDFWIIDTITALIFFYLWIKHVPPMRQLVCWLIELVPWLGALPLLTLGWGLTVWADRHPSGIVAKAGALAETAQGRRTLAAGTAAAKGVGAQSLARMERAEGRVAEWKGRIDEKIPGRTARGETMSPAETSASRAAPGGEVERRPSAGGGGVAQGVTASSTGEPTAQKGSAQYAQQFAEEHDPMRQLHQQLLQQSPGTKERGEPALDDDDGTVDLRAAA